MRDARQNTADSPLVRGCATALSATVLAVQAALPKDSKGTVPPQHIPGQLLPHYTMGEAVAAGNCYYDNRAPSLKHFSMAAYARAFEQLASNSYEYYGETLDYILAALKDFPLKGKSVCVFGAEGVNCDAIALVHGAAHVYIVDYNPGVSEHPDVSFMSYETLRAQNIRCDAAFSISSFEHDGLGRYGDPLNPNGDLAAMLESRDFLKPEGLLFLAVPIGRDSVEWNAHRIYGLERLPLLLHGWGYKAQYGFNLAQFSAPQGEYTQPLLVLGNLADNQPPDSAATKLLYTLAAGQLEQARHTARQSHAKGIQDAIDNQYVCQHSRQLASVAKFYWRMLTPKDVKGRDFVRIGKDFDGGYIMLDDFSPNQVAYSFGIADDVSWDMAMAQRGIPVYMYDPSITALPARHPLFHFTPQGLCAAKDTKARYATLADLLERNGHLDHPSLILKMDIENAEWDVLAELPDSILQSFAQMTFELHSAHRHLANPGAQREKVLHTLARLKTFHEPVHLHLNNNGNIILMGGYPVPELLEVTYVRKGGYRFGPCTRRFPTPLDQPCMPHLPSPQLVIPPWIEG